MAIRLEKGQKINLEKSGRGIVKFYVGCNWGAITHKSRGLFGLLGKTNASAVDLDLSCIIFDSDANIIDHIYSPEYRRDFLRSYKMPPGQLTTRDGALTHSGDDRSGDQGGDDGEDNEVISVDLSRITPAASQIFFFLNNVGPEDFSMIPYASIRMYEGVPGKIREVFASYNVASEPGFAGKRALVMGKLYKRDGKWRFSAIGDAVDDANICETILRVQNQYAR